jgi:hypothetical protein
MIYECTIKNPKKIRAFWIDRAEHAAKILGLPLPQLGEMETKQIQKYTESLWKIIEESEGKQ